VLGASGFVGRWVVRALVARGAEVVAQVRHPARLPAAFARGAEVRAYDLAPRGAARELVARVHPGVVLNLAGYGVAKDERDEAGYRRINAELSHELVRALEARNEGPGLALVQLGSALEYGRSADLDERAEAQPYEPYGRTKLAGTQRLASARGRVPSVVARAFTVFGPGERTGRLVPTLLAARATSGRIPLSDGAQRRDFVYVEDVARALDPATVRGGRYPFDAPCLNLASGALTPVRDFVLALADELGIARERLGFGDLPPLPEEMHHPPVPVERLRAALGWSPSPDVHAAVRRMTAHLREGLG
jgi:nucleoside-diphosphate-sugar epimerase